MTDVDAEAEMLLRYLQTSREAMVWKLDDVGEHDVRRPMTPTGTNLLGLVKHVASMEMGYFTAPIGRPSPVPMPWLEEGAAFNADLYATEDESRDWVLDFYRTAWRTTDDAVAELGLDAAAQVPWWGEHGRTTLGRLVVHLIAETARHAGHADILRERLDGTVGMGPGGDNMPPARPGPGSGRPTWRSCRASPTHSAERRADARRAGARRARDRGVERRRGVEPGVVGRARASRRRWGDEP